MSIPNHPSEGFWARLGAALVRHARPVAVVMLVISAVAGGAAGLLLKVRPGYVDLLDPKSPLQRRYLDLIHELGNVEPLYVVVESDDPVRAGMFVDAFAERVRALTGADGRPLASSVVARVDLGALRDRAPAWLPASAIDRLAAMPELPAVVGDPSPDRVLAAVRSAIRSETEAASSGETTTALTPDALTGLLRGMTRVAKGDAPPNADALMPSASQGSTLGLDASGHIQLGAGRLLVTVMPVDATNDARILSVLVRGARKAADDADDVAGGGVHASFTGAPALIVDEMRAVQRDIALASALSFVLVTLLFFVSFNSLRHVVFAAIANACGLALTFGAAWLLIGYLNLFSSVFAAVLAGLGIDFGIHFINFYEARRRDGEAAAPALVDAYAHVVPPIAISAVTTAAAFFTVMTSDFAGFSQLGLISGVGVLLCLITAFTLVPALLAWESRRRPAHPESAKPPWSLPILLAPVRAWRIAAPLGALVVLACCFGATRLRFDHDLMNLQPAGTEAVALQRDGSRRVGTHPAFSLAPNVEEARRRAEALRALPSVASVQSPADALPPADPDRGPALQRLSDALASVSPSASPIDLAAARRQADGLATELTDLQDLAFEGGREADVKALGEAHDAATLLSSALGDPAAAPRLAQLRDDLATRLQRMRALLPEVAARGVQPQDLPEGLRSLVGSSGRIAMAITPRESIWNRAALVTFLGEIRTVDPDVTGPAVQVAEITELMRVSLNRAAWLGIVVIAALVLLSTRHVGLALLSMLPLACGFVMMLGGMKLLGVPLNPANLVALPLLLGIGVDGGVHLVHRWSQVRDVALTVTEVGHALLITSLTTVAGFLPLLFARHHGIRSLGAATCLGSLGMLIAVVVLAPAFLAAIDALGPARRPSSATDEAAA